ncbi:methylenetetrahydrofolate reductase 1 [Madurella fahalii]|uniref:Methylenetetrahydrofolate reductase 1 n=1 Tax=Madurella fahalii TaxID=1157608 RepID=A0ABQ0GGC8_9PEZI
MASNRSAPQSRRGEQPRKRRRIENAIEELVDRELRQRQLVTDPAKFKWDRNQIQVEPGSTLKFIHIDENRVLEDRRGWEPSLLETIPPQVNWYASNKNRNCANGYVMKGVADNASAEALVNTLLELCKKHNTPTWNIYLELESSKMSSLHRKEVCEMLDTRRAQHPEPDLSINMPDPKRKGRGPKTPGNSEDKCANCGNTDHKASHCQWPSVRHGSIRACALCNDASHVLDNCPKLKGVDVQSTEFLNKAGSLLMSDRGHKPQLRSERFPFYDLLKVGSKHPGNTLDLNGVYVWPWSNEFAKKVAVCKPGDPILRGKLHPKEFVHGKHTSFDLPADPLFDGKSVAEIRHMRGTGALDTDRFVSSGTRKRSSRPTSPKHGALKKGIIKTPDRFAADRTVIKQEDDDGDLVPTDAAVPGPSHPSAPAGHTVVNKATFRIVVRVNDKNEPTWRREYNQAPPGNEGEKDSVPNSGFNAVDPSMSERARRAVREYYRKPLTVAPSSSSDSSSLHQRLSQLAECKKANHGPPAAPARHIAAPPAAPARPFAEPRRRP